MTRITWIAGIAGLVALASCHDATAPLDLNGRWRVVYKDMTAGGFVCNVEAIDFAIIHSGTTLTGMQIGPAVRVCAHDATVVSTAFSGETLAGTLSGTTVSFVLGVVPGSDIAADNSASGTLDGDVIAGSAQWTDPDSASNLDGTFTATRMR